MAKTDWQMGDIVQPADMNQIGQEINQNRNDLAAHAADYVRHPDYVVATGTANNYAVTLDPAPGGYVEGMGIIVKIPVDSNGPCSLNVNGYGPVPIVKPNGTAVTNLKGGGVYSLRYSTGNFILLGEGGSGDAQPGDVLSGKKFTNDNGEQVGTMPNRGNVSQTLTNQGQEYTIPAGYHAGGGKVTANITNLSAPNIKYGATVGGVAGTFSQTANGASAGQILSGREAFVNGAQVIGTMPNRTGHVTGQSISRSGTTLRIRPQAGYYPGGSGNSVQWDDPNWVAANIRQGVSIFGLVGTLVEGKRWASGTATPVNMGTQGDHIQVSGLAFQPRFIIAYLIANGEALSVSTFVYDGIPNLYTSSIRPTVMAFSPFDFVLHDSTSSVGSGSFSLRVSVSNGIYQWYAFE